MTRFTRGLRFRLTIIYVLLFTLLLILIGLGFRQNLQREMEGEVRALLEEEWGAAKGYIRIENQRPIWTADTTDPEEAHIVERLRYVHLLADAEGNVLTDSPLYESIGVESPAEIRRILKLKEPEIRIRYDRDGTPYMIKAGVMPDENREPYFFAIGRSLADTRRTVYNFTRSYLLFLPLIVAITGVLGWLLAGRAIEPVNSLANTTHTITSSNLSLKIPPRGANDELDHLIESFNQMTERLQHSFEQIRQFSTDVSHELRTPLTAIRGQLEVALFTAQKPEQYQEAIVTALESVEQLSSIVRALLLLSQAESGQLVLQKTPLNLSDTVQDLSDQFQIPAEEKRIDLQAVVTPGVVIPADRTQIERLLSNLLSNALKYTPEGGSVTTLVDRDPHTGAARLIVRDSGVGIPAENLPHIFDRFYRVRNPQTNAIQGLGLGLSFVAWIVSAHGGHIDVSSQVGQGTTFTVTLPAEAEGSVKPAPEPASSAV